MKIESLIFVTLLFALTGCATQTPVAVQCPEQAPVSKWMMEPSKNQWLMNSSSPAPKTPQK